MQIANISTLIQETQDELIRDLQRWSDPIPTDDQISGENLGFDLREAASRREMPVLSFQEGKFPSGIQDQLIGKEYNVGISVRLGEAD